MTMLRDGRDQWAKERRVMNGELQSLRHAKLMHRTDLTAARKEERRKCVAELLQWGEKGSPGAARAVRTPSNEGRLQSRCDELAAQVDSLLRENLVLRRSSTSELPNRPYPSMRTPSSLRGVVRR